MVLCRLGVAFDSHTITIIYISYAENLFCIDRFTVARPSGGFAIFSGRLSLLCTDAAPDARELRERRAGPAPSSVAFAMLTYIRSVNYT